LEAFDHSVIDASGSQTDRIGNADTRARAMRDDDEAPKAEKVAATVGVWIETAAHSPRRRPDEESPELPS